MFTAIGKAFASGFFVLIAFSPLRIGRPVFVAGTALFVLGMAGLVIALFNFKGAPPGQPAIQGLYRVSRNPQWMMLVLMFLGVCLAIGSWAALLLLAAAGVCYHFRILAEERSCLDHYGDGYRDYMAQVPRYLLFL